MLFMRFSGKGLIRGFRLLGRNFWSQNDWSTAAASFISRSSITPSD